MIAQLTDLMPLTNKKFVPTTPAQAADARLVERCRQGDTEAFDELVISYQDAVYRQAYWILGEKEAAEDAAQEAFFLAYQKLDRFKGGSFRAWLLAVTTNASIDMLRRTRKHPVMSLEVFEDQEECGSWSRDDQPSPEQVVEQSYRTSTIQEALMRLPMDSRIAILLIDIQELDYQSAAAMLRVPLGTLKSRVARARMRLMDMLPSDN
jgi:RNA polymerase sigma-70 factor, ECF subfamily